MAKLLEKRKFSRVPFGEKVRVFPVVSPDSGNIYQVQTDSFESKARDIGEGGLGLESTKDFPGSSLLKLLFEVQKDQPVEVIGKVVWSDEKNLGVRFLFLDSSLRKDILAMPRKKA